MQSYTDTIRKYATDDRFTGELSNADGIGEVGLGAAEAGKRLAVRFTLKLVDQQIETVRFKVFGCGFTIAACTAAAELATGKPAQAALALSRQQIDEHLHGLPEERDYCADLALGALQAAITSATGDRRPVQTSLQPEEDHGPRISAEHPVYQALQATRTPPGISPLDRHLFACLLAIADQEPWSVEEALGLEPADLELLLDNVFPGFAPVPKASAGSPPEVNPDLREILRSHVPEPEAAASRMSRWLAQVLAARAAHAGHLWVAMGLFERPELSAAIGRHLPSLLAANNKGMRWKRYLFKQVCDLNGGTMCKSPNCGLCSDYALCFES